MAISRQSTSARVLLPTDLDLQSVFLNTQYVFVFVKRKHNWIVDVVDDETVITSGSRIDVTLSVETE